MPLTSQLEGGNLAGLQKVVDPADRLAEVSRDRRDPLKGVGGNRYLAGRFCRHCRFSVDIGIHRFHAVVERRRSSSIPTDRVILITANRRMSLLDSCETSPAPAK